MNFDALLNYLEDHATEIMRKAGAHTVGIGKNADGESVLNIYVEQQPTEEEAEALQESLPGTVKIPCRYLVEELAQEDILYVNDLELEEMDFGRYRPLVGGIQLYLKNNNSAWIGTLGTFVKSKSKTDDKLYLLSNKHVLDTVGLSVCQPLFSGENIVATVSKVEEFDNTDAALAEVLNPSDVEVNTIEEIGKVAETRSVTQADIGKKVVKRGRTTGRTVGTIESIHATRIISGVTRRDCVVVRANQGEVFSNPGDSGSPVVMQGEGKLVGLHFAGNRALGGISIFCTTDNVFNNYNIELPN